MKPETLQFIGVCMIGLSLVCLGMFLGMTIGWNFAVTAVREMVHTDKAFVQCADNAVFSNYTYGIIPVAKVMEVPTPEG